MEFVEFKAKKAAGINKIYIYGENLSVVVLNRNFDSFFIILLILSFTSH